MALGIACALCFGRSDALNAAGQLSGYTWGLFVLMGSVLSLCLWIGWTVYTIEKNRTIAEGPQR